MIEISGLSFSYRKERVLDEVDLKIRAGEFVGIMGPVGSGKTTLLLTLNGIIPHMIKGNFEGEVKIFGRDTRETRVPQLARDVGIVFQDPDSQIFSLKVRDEVAFGLENIGVPREETEARVREALRAVGLAERINEDPNNLSGGQKQKLALACVLAMDQKIFALDEPVSNMEQRGAVEIYEILRRANEKGKTVIVVEHDSELLLEYADRIIVLNEGKIALDAGARRALSNSVIAKLGLKVPCELKRKTKK
ncbi:MAG: ABC transporter ATP-binding protein [Candidatus Micrarchaeota archaeon]